jgi:hypothetical protein
MMLAAYVVSFATPNTRRRTTALIVKVIRGVQLCMAGISHDKSDKPLSASIRRWGDLSHFGGVAFLARVRLSIASAIDKSISGQYRLLPALPKLAWL